MAKKTVVVPDLGASPTKRVSLKRIKAAAYNPRIALKPGDPEYEKLARSIDEFGLVEPLIWNKRTGNLVGGHQRMTVLKARGVKSADVVVVDLEPIREKALNLALNKITGRWDTDKLAVVLDELAKDDLIDELVTGFDETEIDDLLAGIDDSGEDPDSARGDPRGRAKLAEQLEYRIIVECTGEKHQLRLLKRFEKEGLICRALIS